MTEIKIGAKVTICGVVMEREYGGAYKVRFRRGDWSWLAASDFVSVENPPEEIKIGDRVRHTALSKTGEILAIDGKWAWVRTGIEHASFCLDALEKLP